MNSGQYVGKRFMTAKLLAWATLLPGFGAAHAQTVQPSGGIESVEEIVVTGSRIRRADPGTPAPITTLDQQALTDRGFVQVGQALNAVSSITPSLPIRGADGLSNSSGGGEQAPALFGLGAGRTLTLVNGRRFVSTASSFGIPGALQGSTNDSVVDTNIIPTGLLSRVEIVQGAGAAVYGSDAMGGVINYLLRDDFEGLEVDAQYGRSSRDDYPVSNARVTWGTNFADRGNVAINAEWSRTEPLLSTDRPRSALGRITSTNPADTGPGDGIASVAEVLHASFWEFTGTGVLFTPPDPTGASCGGFPQRCFITTNGVQYNQFAPGGIPAQFNAAGTELTAFDPGTFPSPGPSIPFAAGGDGFGFRDLGALYSGVERASANLIGHYDLSPTLKLSTELLYSNVKGEDPKSSLISNTILNAPDSGAGPIPVRAANPFLTDAARTSIMNYLNANPALFGPNSGFGWAAGAPLPIFLSKLWPDLVPSTAGEREIDTTRAVLALDGDFKLAARDFYWSASASYGRTQGSIRTWNVWVDRFNNAIDATSNGASTVCGINADADPGNDDPACAPLNPFGVGNVSEAARNYVSARFGQDFDNTQYDYLATLGGDLYELPGGNLSFSVAYEHRQEDATFTPTQAARLGIGPAGVPEAVQSGEYHTNEFSAELLVPVFGRDFRLPGVHSLDVSGAYRSVDNSIAGSENVWSAGLRWRPIEDVMLRVSRSRNFRAPNLAQLFAPESTGLEGILVDPCDAQRIDAGPNPAVRRANCEALFAANPGYGPLATFEDPAENFPIAQVTRGGNRNLKNELSDTLSFGIVLQPSFARGLTIVADRLEVDLENGLSFFEPPDFLATCFDSAVQPADICAVSTRNAVGHVIASSARTFNAGSIKFRGETYEIDYGLAVGPGTLDLTLEGTHVSLLETSVTGVDLTRTDGTAEQPDWRARFDARYQLGPVRLAYTLDYLPEVLAVEGATVENNAHPVISANYRHSISAQYDVTSYLAIRAGIENLTDEQPSYPTIVYGDILGRQYYLGARAKF